LALGGGGILLAFKINSCKVIQYRIDTFSVSAQFQHSDGTPWWLTELYGPQLDNLKILFLQELQLIRNLCNGPWMIGEISTLFIELKIKTMAT
jgi:hypothetical protein